MRDATFVGLSADGHWLIVERDGEHLRVPVDARLRRALHDEVQMPMPLQTAVSPREVQHRIRAGETAAQIAKSAGVSVELIARFEGPVLDERRWQTERARHTVVDGLPLEERFALATRDDDGHNEGHNDAHSAPTAWDAWVDAEDGGWRVRAISPAGESAVWTWDTHTTKLRGRDDLARRTLSGRIVADDLEAVLRPIAAGRAARPEPVAEARADSDAEPARPTGGTKRRTSIPSWDEIMLGSTARPSSSDET
jgi:hypothetical protein